MPIEILMPSLSPTMKDGVLAKWLKKEGDSVKPGDIIAEIETDKATMELEAVDKGVIATIVVPAGAKNVPINSLIAVLCKEGEDINECKNYHLQKRAESLASKESSVKELTAEAKPSNLSQDDASSAHNLQAGGFVANKPKTFPVIDIKQAKIKNNQERTKISPLAKNIAIKYNIDYRQLIGSGPNGRIIRADVESYLKNARIAPTIKRHPEEFSIVKHTTMREVIANRLVESKQFIPHFYLTLDCDLTSLSDIRTQVNNVAGKDEKGAPYYKVSVNDLIVKAVSLALKNNPDVNSSWTDEAIVLYNNIDIAVAVAIAGGLITPVIRNADMKTIFQISNEIKNLAKRAQSGKLLPEEYQGGGFCLSNLGMYNIKQFNAIINPPQSCILAIGASEKRPIVRNDKIEIREMLTLTLSADHRVIDGATAALFLNELKRVLENPAVLLL